MKPQTKLPDKASELLRLAVADSRAVSKLKSRTLDMNVYHTPLPGRKCAVCMAGAVMDRTLRADPKRFLMPGAFEPDTEEKLRRINCLRRGCDYALGTPAGDLIQKHFNRETGRAPWRIYLRAARMLETMGR